MFLNSAATGKQSAIEEYKTRDEALRAAEYLKANRFVTDITVIHEEKWVLEDDGR